jgi:hypothetical protein
VVRLDGRAHDQRYCLGSLYDKALNVSGTAIKGGHSLFIVNWLRQ